MNIIPNYGRVQRLRTARGLTQADLAEHLSMPASALSRLLSGQLPFEESDALRLAAALGCSLDMLTRPVADSLYTKPWLRAYADAPKKTVEQYVADTLLAMEAVAGMHLKRMPDRLPIFDGDPNDDDEVDEFATEVRQAGDVPPIGPVPNVTRAAERLGCIVLPIDSELGKHLGMSMVVDGTPVIRVCRPSGSGGVPGDRQRFTVAHELGHVTLHASTPPPETADQARTIEKQAHRFAAAFLLPGDSFLDALDQEGGRVTLATLSRLKERWGVAIKAMVIRLQQLHRIDGDHARSLYKQISARGWNKDEPARPGNEGAIWFGRALAQRFPSEGTAAAAADFAGLEHSYISSWSDWQPAADATVIQLPIRMQRGQRSRSTSRNSQELGSGDRLNSIEGHLRRR